jgi:CDP-4-dehydro-6-deoxyglucose reductase, E1
MEFTIIKNKLAHTKANTTGKGQMIFNWPLINNNITLNDKKALADFILNTDRFTNGPKVKEFESKWSEWLGSKYSVMVGSGASANYITTAIVRELKGQKGEIIVPPIGWVSDVSAIINTGFTPVFVDVDINTMAISYENIKNAINKKTKAIVLVHALGFNGINEKIIELAKENDLLLIEDCCESHGATYRGMKVGTIGDMSCFSFYFGHHMTTIEGGMICTDDYEIYQLARMFRSHGMTREADKETHEKYAKPDVNPLFTFAVAGYNMRSTELNAVIGLEQIKRLDSNIEKRQNNLNLWLSNLDSSKYYTEYSTEGSSNYALPLILNKDNDKITNVCNILEEEKVEYRLGTAGGGNQARQPYLEKYNFEVVGNLNTSNYIHDFGLYIGNHPELKRKQIIDLCRRLNNV